jgi:hypothetical protein
MTEELSWRDRLQQAQAGIEALSGSIREYGEADLPRLVVVVNDLTQAVAGLVAAEPQVKRWKPDEPLPPAGNLPQDAGTDHLWPPRAGE